MKTALITGITGQDGSYLAELLINKGYQVHGIIRSSSTFNTGRIAHLYDDPKIQSNGCFVLHYGDLCDNTCLIKVLSQVKPDEVYNLAAQSHVKVSFDLAESTSNVDAIGTLHLLNAIKTCGMEKKVRFYQASTSEIFGKVQEVPQKESTPFYPRNPYGVSKAYAHWIVVNYRESYGMFACNGIMFNHESPRRGETFVTRKITRSVAKIHLGLMDKFELGNIDSKKDWGHAKDYVEGMWKILQQEQPEDFVLATGKVHSVRDFVEAAFMEIEKEICWEGSGVDEVGKEKKTGIIRITINPKFFRPDEMANPSRPQCSAQKFGEPPITNAPDDFLQGDASKALRKMGWKPTLTFQDLVSDMVQADIELLTKDPMA